MKLLWTSLLAVSLLIAAVPDAGASRTSLRRAYDGATPFGPGAIEDECSTTLPASIGVVCLDVPRGVHDVTFSISDTSSLAAGGSYYVYDDAGELVGAGRHCGGGVASVDEGYTLVVRMELINGPIVCMEKGMTGGAATRGFVLFDLR